MTARDRLVLALDVETPALALELARRTASSIGVFKASPAHVYQDGEAYIAALRALGRPVFLDLKLNDIPETVARLTRQVARMGVAYLTVHTTGGSKMMAAAQAAVAETGGTLKLLGVTVLTSFDQEQVRTEWAVTASIEERVLALADLARGAGLHGIVCSPLELKAVRARFGTALATVVPGIRSSTDSAGDQKRTMSPAEAVAAGADYIVVGRPIVAQPDPVAAAHRMTHEMEEAPQ